MSKEARSGPSNLLTSFYSHFSGFQDKTYKYLESVDKKPLEKKKKPDKYLSSQATELYNPKGHMTFEEGVRLHTRYGNQDLEERLTSTTTVMRKNFKDVETAYLDLVHALNNSRETDDPPYLIEPTQMDKFSSPQPQYKPLCRRQIGTYKFKGPIVPEYITSSVDSLIEQDNFMSKLVKNYRYHVNILRTGAAIENTMLHVRYGLAKFRGSVKEKRKEVEKVTKQLIATMGAIWGTSVLVGSNAVSLFVSGLVGGVAKGLVLGVVGTGVTFTVGAQLAMGAVEGGTYIAIEGQKKESQLRQLSLKNQYDKIGSLYSQIIREKEELERRHSEVGEIITSGVETIKLADDAIMSKRNKIVSRAQAFYKNAISAAYHEHEKYEAPTEEEIAEFAKKYRGVFVDTRDNLVSSVQHLAYHDKFITDIVDIIEEIPQELIVEGEDPFIKKMSDAFNHELLSSADERTTYFFQQTQLFTFLKNYGHPSEVDINGGVASSLIGDIKGEKYKYFLQNPGDYWTNYVSPELYEDLRDIFAKNHPLHVTSSISQSAFRNAAGFEKMFANRSHPEIAESELSKIGLKLSELEDSYKESTANNYLFSSGMMLLSLGLRKLPKQRPKREFELFEKIEPIKITPEKIEPIELIAAEIEPADISEILEPMG
jgi:hypothetical protein